MENKQKNKEHVASWLLIIEDNSQKLWIDAIYIESHYDKNNCVYIYIYISREREFTCNWFVHYSQFWGGLLLGLRLW